MGMNPNYTSLISSAEAFRRTLIANDAERQQILLAMLVKMNDLIMTLKYLEAGGRQVA